MNQVKRLTKIPRIMRIVAFTEVQQPLPMKIDLKCSKTL